MELDELKQEMRSAQITAWLTANRQMVGAIGAIVIIALLAGTLWSERVKADKRAAATIYYQALALDDRAKRKALLENIVRDYGRTGYAPLSLFQLVSLDEARAREYLTRLLASDAPEELKWQARLDLAERLIDGGHGDRAAALLEEKVGEEYEQLRHYLRAEVAREAARRREELRRALAAPSHDGELRRRIERLLAAEG
ncbi:MAG: hypothetical protein D6682_02705 [Zetaproteobacteria bacterium]|nr:MAG: hypothetical protein D6682_02705 [Zetaproteobacteria bacterium]